MNIDDLRPGLVVQDREHNVLKISTIYNEDFVTAQLVYPVPDRDTVREYHAADVLTWTECSTQAYNKYVAAYEQR